jgi:hypothetical protein
MTVIILGVGAVYALARGIVDVAQRRYAWGAAGILCAALLALTPIATHAVKVDLPQASAG